MILKIDNVSEQQLKNLVLFLDGPENLLSNQQDDLLRLKEGQHASAVQSYSFKMAVLLKANRDGDMQNDTFSLTIKIYEGFERGGGDLYEQFQIGRIVIDGILDALEKFPREED